MHVLRIYKSTIWRFAHAIALLTCKGRLRHGRYVYEKLQRDKMADVYHSRQETL